MRDKLNHFRPVAVSLAFVGMLTLSTAASAQSAAALAPGDSGVFIQIDGLADLRADWQEDELMRFVRSQLPRVMEPAPWKEIRNVLQMDSGEVIDRYFGQSLAVVASSTRDNSPWILLTKVSGPDFALLSRRFDLRLRGQINGFHAYVTPDDKARFAFGRGWMLVADRQHEEAAVAFLKNVGQGESLAEDDEFGAWMDRLPTPRMGVAFARDPEKDEAHALALLRDGRSLSLHYAGRASTFAEVYEKLGQAGAMEFGPLPRGTLGAVTLNVGRFEPDDTAVMDRLLAPRTFMEDVAPKLAAPMVAFVGEVLSDELPGEPGYAMPVVGLAVKLKDVSAARDLDRIFDGLMVIANVATMKWQTPAIIIQHVTPSPAEAKTPQAKAPAAEAASQTPTYRVVDVGATLAERAKRPELAPMRLTYGRIGRWYIICTQDQFYRQCLAAHADASQSLGGDGALAGVPIHRVDTPIASAFVRGDALAAHMQSWLDHWRQTEPRVVAQAKAFPLTPEARAVRGVIFLQGVLEHFPAVSAQIHRGEDGVARARLDMIRE